MDELQVKTLQMSPAVIEFNHKDIEEELKKSLAQYDGLTFTSESTTELRGTLAYLRKGKTAVDEYRKKIKRELNEPVNKFEDKCKELNVYFDDVIDPLNEQLTTFVEQERAEKRDKLESVKADLIQEYDLNAEYVDRVVIEDTYLAKATSIKLASESIEFQIKQLKMEQDKIAADKEIIITTAKLANAENDLTLSIDAFVRLLEFEGVDEVKKQIDRDVSKTLEQRRIDAKRKEEAQRKEEQSERDRIQKIDEDQKASMDLELRRIESEGLEQIARDERANIVQEQAFDPEPIEDEPIGFDDLPFADLDDPFADIGTVRRSYEIFGTDEQFKELERAMNDIGLDWGVLIE